MRQLKDINKVNFDIASGTKRDYMDVLRQVHANDQYDEDSMPLFPGFFQRLKNVFSDQNNHEKLIKLGATDLDIAFVTGDVEKVQEILDFNAETNLYLLSNKLRFYNLYKSMYPESSANIEVPIGLDAIPIQLLLENNYVLLNESNMPKNNAAIIITGFGQRSFDSKQSHCNMGNVDKMFGTSILVGSGDNYVWSGKMLDVLDSKAVSSLKKKDLDFVFININLHDSPKGSIAKIIPKLADISENLGKELIVFISGCYSGQYHKLWKGGATLVTSADAENSSSGLDTLKFKEADFSSKENVLEVIKRFEYSKPMISGKVNGQHYKNVSLKDLDRLDQICFDDIDNPQFDESGNNEKAIYIYHIK